jgi:hypothetical protein
VCSTTWALREHTSTHRAIPSGLPGFRPTRRSSVGFGSRLSAFCLRLEREADPHANTVTVPLFATSGLRNGQQGAAGLVAPDAGFPLVVVDAGAYRRPPPPVRDGRSVFPRHGGEVPGALPRMAKQRCGKLCVVRHFRVRFPVVLRRGLRPTHRSSTPAPSSSTP